MDHTVSDELLTRLIDRINADIQLHREWMEKTDRDQSLRESHGIETYGSICGMLEAMGRLNLLSYTEETKMLNDARSAFGLDPLAPVTTLRRR